MLWVPSLMMLRLRRFRMTIRWEPTASSSSSLPTRSPTSLAPCLRLMGFAAVARHRSKRVTLYRQGDVNYVLNAEPDSFAAQFTRGHGPSACAMGFRVVDAAHAQKRAIALGAKPVATPVGPDGA